MKKEIYETLCQICGSEQVFCEESMSRHTTFRTGGPADILVTPKAEQISEILALCKEKQIPWTVIGNGSNLLVGDGGIRGVVLEIGKQMSEISIEGTKITAGAGAMLSAIASKAAAQELTGLEFASGIPGSIGGAVVMNAGAYGGEMKDVLASVDVLTQDLEIKTIPAAELNLGYRCSSIPEKGYIVLGATLQLKKGNAAEIRGRMAELAEQRRAKQPLQYPSAGSTFKRPEGYFAGKLVQDAGLKGKTIGGAQVSEKHSGFLINIGGATAQDILDLIAFCQKEVKDKFGVTLETEVKIVGEE